MLLEQEIEKKLMDKLTALLDANGIADKQVYGTLQPDLLKAKEQDCGVLLVVKVSPRSYSSPTIPTCNIDVTVQLNTRADIDFQGKTYLDVCAVLMEQWEKWQRCMEDAHEDFTIPDRFTIVGFQLGKGTTAIDGDKTIWQYTTNFTLFGVVESQNHNQ